MFSIKLDQLLIGEIIQANSFYLLNEDFCANAFLNAELQNWMRDGSPTVIKSGGRLKKPPLF